MEMQRKVETNLETGRCGEYTIHDFLRITVKQQKSRIRSYKINGNQWREMQRP